MLRQLGAHGRRADIDGDAHLFNTGFLPWNGLDGRAQDIATSDNVIQPRHDGLSLGLDADGNLSKQGWQPFHNGRRSVGMAGRQPGAQHLVNQTDLQSQRVG